MTQGQAAAGCRGCATTAGSASATQLAKADLSYSPRADMPDRSSARTDLRRALVLGFSLALVGVGCEKAATPVKKAPISRAKHGPAISQEAHSLWKLRCASCHGPTGAGDGVVNESLDPEATDFTDASWQKQASDEFIRKTIVGGGAAVGKSPTMAPQPDLAEKPKLLAELVALVRSFAPADG